MHVQHHSWPTTQIVLRTTIDVGKHDGPWVELKLSFSCLKCCMHFSIFGIIDSSLANILISPTRTSTHGPFYRM
jgi:hypothetical protein